MTSITLDSVDDLEQAPELCEEALREEEIRTIQMNKSLHLWLTRMTDGLNDAGFTQRKLWERMQAAFELPVTERMLKETFQEVAFSMYGERKTSKLKTWQMQKVYEAVNRGFGLCAGVSLGWPNRNSQSMERICEQR